MRTIITDPAIYAVREAPRFAVLRQAHLLRVHCCVRIPKVCFMHGLEINCLKNFFTWKGAITRNLCNEP